MRLQVYLRGCIAQNIGYLNLEHKVIFTNQAKRTLSKGPFIFTTRREAVEYLEQSTSIITSTGQAIQQAGGGVNGALSIVIVVLFIGMVLGFTILWRAYQALLKESRERETKYIEMNLNSQSIQKDTNDILRGIQTFMGTLDLRMKYLEKCVEEDIKREGTGD
jgi:hypothetical protein